MLALMALLAVFGVAPVGGQMQYRDAGGDVTLALVGDAIITRKLSVYDEPAFLRLRELIQRSTVAFANLEVLFHDFGDDAIPASESGGTYMGADPSLAKDLAWMGFDLVSRANNHALDYGVGGMRATTRALEAAGLAHAGTGENLARARAPAYVETRDGRVALVSVASTFADHMRAGPQRKDLRGRPGLSPLRYDTRYIVPRDRFNDLLELRKKLGSSGASDARDSTEATILRNRFVVGDDYKVVTSPNPRDLEEIVATVKDAKRQANRVIVSSHTHEQGSARDVPADFLIQFAHAVIDAGADVFVGHGPHLLRAIEIYKGKPIFYSLGDFIFQNETVLFQPADNYEQHDLAADALPGEFYDRREKQVGGFRTLIQDAVYWESVVATVRFTGDKVSDVRLYPITLGHGLPRPQRGRPLLAGEPLGRKIIDDLRRLSRSFGTQIDYSDGIGTVSLPVNPN